MENPAQLQTLRHCFRTRPVRRNETFWRQVIYAVTITCAQERLCLPLCLLSFLDLKKARTSAVFSIGHSALSVPIIAQSHSESLGEGTLSFFARDKALALQGQCCYSHNEQNVTVLRKFLQLPLLLALGPVIPVVWECKCERQVSIYMQKLPLV